MPSLPDSKSLPQIVEAFGLSAPLTYHWEEELPVWAFSTDSRQIKPGGWFVALRGENFDGHLFCKQALQAGAKGLIVSEVNPDWACPILQVTDTLRAYQAIAQAQRRALNPLVLGITGSNGKTGSKELANLVLAQKYLVSATSANENNEIGVPKSILEADPQADMLVLEMGMRGLGQIAELVKIAEPTHTLVTNIGTAHIGLLGSREKIAQAKAEIFTASPRPQIAYLPYSEILLKSWIPQKPDGVQVRLFGNFQIQSRHDGCSRFYYRKELYELRTLHLGLIHNACAIIDLALDLGITPPEIQVGLHLFQTSVGRGRWHHLGDEVYLIDDSYNANPDSVLALAQSISDQEARKVLVLGEMAELGEFGKELLTDLAHKLDNLLDRVLLIGANLKPLEEILSAKAIHFDSIDHVLGEIESEMKRSPSLIIAVKGSRLARLNELVAEIRLTWK